MLFARNSSGKRIKAEISGEIAVCEICQNSLRAYCGDININHWRHVNDIECDNWIGHETEWHREWKKKFPDDWQEVVVKKDNEIHRADIKTPNGLVLELQNSSISASEIAEREVFYQNLIWLINVDSFENNFVIWSNVTSKLRELELDKQNFEHNVLDDDEKKKVRNLEKEHRNIETEIDSLKNSIEYNNKRIDEYKEVLKNIKIFANKIISGNYYHSYGFNTAYNETYKGLKTDIKTHKVEKRKIENILDKISKLEYCTLNGLELFQFVNPKNVNPKSYKYCKAIEKETENSFFPTIKDINTKIEYQRLSINKNYRIVIDLSYRKRELQNDLINLDFKVNEIERTIDKSYKIFCSDIERHFKEIKKELKIENKEQKKSLQERRIDLECKRMDVDQEIENENEIVAKRSMEYEHELKKEKSRIMNLYKGSYGYKWKHRRKSWNNAEKDIYLDFDRNIFKIIGENSLRKISKSEFVELIKNWR